ncbi:MAG: EamA/RhaT family transporter [Dethiobacter sp.]|jgi:drug/metabolite transporter (DMT)-like permease|nr:MAG: EamA/RhaT family transporter [Dethiobacter sp.]
MVSLLATGKDFGRSRAVIYLVITAVLWSMGGILIKLVPWHPIAIAGTRSAIASLLFLTVIRKPKWRGTTAQIGGAVAYAATVILFVAATKMTTAANAILLQYTAPVYVALFGAWFLKERTGPADWVTVLTVIAGMFLFFRDDLTPGNMLGNIMAILSGLSFAALILFLRKQKNDSPLESVFFGNILTALIAIPFLPGQQLPDLTGWIVLSVLGVFQLGLSYILYSIAIKHVTALDAILIPVVEPILNPVWVLLFIAETPGLWALVGGVVVLTAVTARCVLPILFKGKAPHTSACAVKCTGTINK